jgi:hypothetical protein
MEGGEGRRWSSGRRRRERNHGKVYGEGTWLWEANGEFGPNARQWGGVGETIARGPGHSQKTICLQLAPPRPLRFNCLPSAFRVVESPLTSSWSRLHHGPFIALLLTYLLMYIPRSLGAAFSLFRSCIPPRLCCMSKRGGGRQIVSKGQSFIVGRKQCHPTHISIMLVMDWGGRSPLQISSPPVGICAFALVLVYDWRSEFVCGLHIFGPLLFPSIVQLVFFPQPVFVGR